MTLEQIRSALADSGVTAELVDDPDVPGGHRLDIDVEYRQCVIIQPADEDAVAKLGLTAPHYEVYFQTWGPDTRWEPGASDDPRMWTLAADDAVVPVALGIVGKVMKDLAAIAAAEDAYEAELAERERAADAERFEADGGASFRRITHID